MGQTTSYPKLIYINKNDVVDIESFTPHVRITRDNDNPHGLALVAIAYAEHKGWIKPIKGWDAGHGPVYTLSERDVEKVTYYVVGGKRINPKTLERITPSEKE